MEVGVGTEGINRLSGGGEGDGWRVDAETTENRRNSPGRRRYLPSAPPPGEAATQPAKFFIHSDLFEAHKGAEQLAESEKKIQRS